MIVAFLFSSRKPEEWYAESLPREGETLYFDHGRYEVARVRHYFSTAPNEPQHRVEILTR
jgi:hypothetical protein